MSQREGTMRDLSRRMMLSCGVAALALGGCASKQAPAPPQFQTGYVYGLDPRPPGPNDVNYCLSCWQLSE